MAFHPYPQLIPSVFNLSGCGPPRRLTVASPWPWVDHPASGLGHATASPCSDSLSLRLPHDGLTSRHAANSQAHSSKGTPSPHATTRTARALTDCRRMVSGTISLPSRGTFHHSLTVLIHYRSSGSIQAYRVVPADSQRIPRARCYSGARKRPSPVLSRTGLSPSPARRPRRLPLAQDPLWPAIAAAMALHVPRPRMRNPRRVSRAHGLATIRFRSPLLTESLLFSLPAGTEMFHFPAFPPRRLCVQRRAAPHHWYWVSPFGHPRITARLAAPRGLSRPPASFIGS